jgi:hypothetical protein
MKPIKLAAAISICCLLFSCYHTEDNPSRSTYYSKCFFLGEKSFSLEGETFIDYIPPEWYPQPEPFESVIVRIAPSFYYYYDDDSYIELYESWKIPGINLSKNKFQIEIDKTANGITIDKSTITDASYKPDRPYCFPEDLPDDFPIARLAFSFNGYIRSDTRPFLRELVYRSKTEYNYYYCDYVFVAEPIDMSRKEIREGKNSMTGYYVDTYYYDLNFSKPGWYKIVLDYHSKFNNDTKFSSTKNNYFSSP